MLRVHRDEPAVPGWTAVPVAGLVERVFATTGGRPSDRSSDRPLLIAVDGRSGSGKSTLAGVLATELGAAQVHTDDVAWWEPLFGWDHLLAEQVLRPLRAGLGVDWRPPQWITRGRPGAITVPKGGPVVVIEGVGAACAQHADLLDAVLWVQCDETTARSRGLARDGGDQAAADFWDTWSAAEERYLERDRPWERAALIVCGTPEAVDVRRAPGEVLVGDLPGGTALGS